MKVSKNISGIQKDYIATFLRGQIVDLQLVLRQIENTGNFDDEYVKECLKRIRRKFYQFRINYN